MTESPLQLDEVQGVLTCTPIGEGMMRLRFRDFMRGASSLALALLLAPVLPAIAARASSPPSPPDTVVVLSGELRLRALVWRPRGPGPHPAILFCHGNSDTPADPLRATRLGPVFARHGYVFFCPFRRGDGLSADQGPLMMDLLHRERAANGEEASMRLQLRLLTSDHLDDMLAAWSALESMPAVDPSRIAVAGHSFGGQLAILLAERRPGLRAVVGFGTSALSWQRSAELRELLLDAVRKLGTPVLHVYAANDFSTKAGEAMIAEMERSGTGRLKILQPVGRTPEEGHAAIYLAIPRWEADVFGFLDRHVKRARVRTARNAHRD